MGHGGADLRSDAWSRQVQYRSQPAADNQDSGTIVVGLAAVIIGETILRTRNLLVILIGCVLGSVIYRIAIQLPLSNGNTFGTLALSSTSSVYDPRQIVMNVRLRF